MDFKDLIEQNIKEHKEKQDKRFSIIFNNKEKRDIFCKKAKALSINIQDYFKLYPSDEEIKNSADLFKGLYK